MNNEEKAREIAVNRYCTNKIKMDVSYYSAVEMGRWKDEQFKVEKDNILNLVNHINRNGNETIIDEIKELLE